MLGTANKRLRKVSIAGLLLSLLATPLLAQATPDEIHKRNKPADSAELAGITERGRALASYDAAAWHATDEVQALHPKDDLVQMYIGHQTKDGWVVAFGKLNAAKDVFLLAFECKPTSDPVHPSVKVNDPAAEDRGQWLQEARAIDTARSLFQVPKRPYNLTVLPAPAGEWYVYAYPAQTVAAIFPIGADLRYRLSSDGTTLRETHKMHVSLIENKLPATGSKIEMTYHAAFLDDAPEDTDVADALMMGGIPMLITCQNFTYQIQADGTAVFLAKTKDFLKDAKK